MPETAKKAAAKAPPPSSPAALKVMDVDGQSVAIYDPDATQVWARLTAPFPEDWVEKLPKQLSRDDRDKSACRQGTKASADGHFCGGYHARAVHLDYVGHAGITMRLNDVLGPGGWDFRPYAETPDGLPVISQATFWAKLTILGVTKWELAANYNGPQEALGDALRRCAMRFGIGTYLWSKSDHAFNLAKDQEPEPEPARPPEPVEDDTPVHVVQVRAILGPLPDNQKAMLASWWDDRAQEGRLPERTNMAALSPDQAVMVEDAVAGIQAAERQAASAQGPQ